MKLWYAIKEMIKGELRTQLQRICNMKNKMKKQNETSRNRRKKES